MDAKWFVMVCLRAAAKCGSDEGRLALIALAEEIEVEGQRLDDERRDNLMRTGSTAG